jgi:hypothetical protein
MSSQVMDIEDHIANCGGSYNDWYCGIASDPRQRLFSDHNVDEKKDAWIFRVCENETTARNVERYFLGKGCRGDEGGGDWQTKYVYAYKITSHSSE